LLGPVTGSLGRRKIKHAAFVRRIAFSLRAKVFGSHVSRIVKSINVTVFYLEILWEGHPKACGNFNPPDLADENLACAQRLSAMLKLCGGGSGGIRSGLRP